MLGAVCGDGSLSALFGITLLNLIVQMKYQTLYNVSKHWEGFINIDIAMIGILSASNS